MDQTAQFAQAVVAAWDAAHPGLWGVSAETWAIVGATFAGPVAAILITIWRERRSVVRERRLWVFRTLLATRQQTVHVDHVRALNSVEIEFYGIEPVMQAWRVYMNHLSSETGILEGQRFLTFTEKGRDLLAKMLAKMADSLGFTMGEIDLRLGYKPYGWDYREGRETELREAAISMFSGRQHLLVRPEVPQSTNPSAEAAALAQRK